jgi:hypothetical protein
MLQREEYIVDFLENNFKVSYGVSNLIINKIILVEEKHLGRIDLLCDDAYGDVNSIDILLKFNQITNPFSMELYDIIAVPDANSARQFYQKEKLATIHLRD